MHTIYVVQILTASIAPVIVISGVGLLLLSITNRYGRAIDRARLLARELSDSDPESGRRRGVSRPRRLTTEPAPPCWPAHAATAIRKAPGGGNFPTSSV